VFKDFCIADLTARNVIQVTDSDFKPNSSGFVDLKIDENLDILCSFANRNSNLKSEARKIKKVYNQAKLFPNPNTGNFSIVVENKDVRNISIIVFDILGKPVFQDNNISNKYDVNLSTLSSGIYFVKLSGNNYNETLKFIKK
jgi:hypothetical protein